MLGKYSKDKDKLIWKDNKSENFSMNSFDSSLESRGEVPSLKGSVGLLGAFKNGFFFFFLTLEVVWERFMTLDQLKRRDWSLANYCCFEPTLAMEANTEEKKKNCGAQGFDAIKNRE